MSHWPLLFISKLRGRVRKHFVLLIKSGIHPIECSSGHIQKETFQTNLKTFRKLLK